jgi:HK97 family phage prohead protease
MAIERRVIPVHLELRTKNVKISSAAGTIAGYAVKWNALSEDLGGFREKVVNGAFTRSLSKNPDVKALINHDPNKIVGRTSNNTLRLAQDHIGLNFECDVIDNSVGRDLIASVRRLDLSQCSFAFTVDKDGEDWSEVIDPDTNSRVPLRSIRSANLLDVSVVCSPAYQATSVGVRDHVDDVSDPDSPEYDPDDPDFDEEYSSLRSLWPVGVPVEIRSHVPNLKPRTAKAVANTTAQESRRKLFNLFVS